MPGGIDTVTSLRPLTCPYHLDTPSAWTSGGSPVRRVPAPVGIAIVMSRSPRRARGASGSTIEPAISTTTVERGERRRQSDSAAGSRKITSPSCSSAAVGDSHANALRAGDAAQRVEERRVKKNKPAYITATKRLLFDSDDSASIVVDASSTCASENSVIAGTR